MRATGHRWFSGSRAATRRVGPVRALLLCRTLATKPGAMCGLALLLWLLPGRAAADDTGASQPVLDRWLEAQSRIETWSADVVETRDLEGLAHPIVTRGRVWFEKPNKFRWQLGDPPRTIAVRKGDVLLIVYPNLKRVERYAIDETVSPAWRQALALLDVGFPTDPKAFRARYELLSTTRTAKGWRFELQPRAEAARELIDRVRIEVSGEGLALLATELKFPDGSTMRNEFVDAKIDPPPDESLFEIDTSGYQIVNPLEQGRHE